MKRQYEAAEAVPESTEIAVQGKIYKKAIRESGYDWYLRGAQITYQDGSEEAVLRVRRVLIRVEEDDCPIGGTVFCSGNMRQMESASNDGNFDERQYYHSLGISAVLYADSAVCLSGSEYAPAECLFHLRMALRGVYADILDESDAGILASMVLGDKSLMEQDTKDLYSSAGISHLLAVSGLHISVIGMSIYRALRRRTAYMLSAALSGETVLTFCIMSGMSVSAVRAGLMFACYLGACVLGRKYDPVRALLAAAACSLLENPFLILNAGFLFSYSAVPGVVLLGGMLQKKEAERDRTGRIVPESLRGRGLPLLQAGFLKLAGETMSGFRMSISVLLVTLPLTARFYYQIPVFGVLVNVILLPFAGILLLFGILGGIAGLFAVLPARLLLFPCRLILLFFHGVCSLVTAGWGGSLITGRPPDILLAAYYLLLILTVTGIRRIPGRGKRPKLRLLFPVLLLAVLFCLPSSGQFSVTFLDVGQGDGIYINGGNGTHYFVDGGSSSESEVGRYRILSFLKYNRVRHIDIWFVSHGDSDHISGLLEILESGYRVDKIVISDQMPEDDAYRELTEAAGENGTEIVGISCDSTLKSGDLSIDFYAWSPDGDTSAEEGTEEISGDAEDRNERSLILLVSYEEYRFLLTGDIGEEQEEWLVSQPGIGTVDVLKAAHHGSKYSNSEALLSAVKPSAVVISCSEDNLYGHPAPEAVARMEAAGSTIFETMESGRIRIFIKEGKLTAEVYKGTQNQ